MDDGTVPQQIQFLVKYLWQKIIESNELLLNRDIIHKIY